MNRQVALRRPRVLILHPSNELYGADRSLLALVREMADVAEPIVILPDDLPYRGELERALRESGIEVLVGPLPTVRRRYLRGPAIIRWVVGTGRGWIWLVRLGRVRHAGAVISNTSGVLIGPLVARSLRVRHHWYLREIVEHPLWFRLVVRSLARLAPGTVIGVSRAVTEWLGPLGARGPIVFGNGVDIPHEVADLPAQPTAVFVGRLNSWKGQDVFVDAAARVHELMPDTRYVIAGGAVPGEPQWADALRARLARLDPTAEFIRWDGEVADTRALMRQAWVVVVPSLRPDPLPNVVLEAMSEGRAVIASASGGIPEMVVDGATGILCDPSHPDTFTRAVEAVLRDRDAATDLGCNARARAESEFSRARWAESWHVLLGRLLEGSANGGGRSR